MRKVFLLHLWPNSLQELQVSLCLLGQEKAPIWGGRGPGKQRDWQGRAPCVHSYYVFRRPLQTLFGSVGKSLVSWIESMVHLGTAKLIGGEGGRTS